MSVERRTRAIWLALAGTVGLLIVANLALLSRRGPAGPIYVADCSACRDGLIISLPRH